jgi:hypothetical protein
MSHAFSTNPKHCKVFLLGTSALVCFALSTPVLAENFVITASDNSTNGTGIADNDIDGSDTVILKIPLTTTAANKGIQTSGDGNAITVTEAGSITTTTSFDTNTSSNADLEFREKGYGIYNNGDGNTTTMSGSISTSGNGTVHSTQRAYGINNEGNGNTTIMSGSISNTGWHGYGINNYGDNNTTTMSGSISTTGDLANGIYNDGNDNTTIMSGSISTAARYGIGVYNDGDNNTTTMSGSFSSTGNFSFGIYNNGDANTTTMSGSISTTGAKAYGIQNGDNNANNNVYSDNNTTTVSGSIKTEGVEAHGIYNDGNNNTTTISGTVKATGAKSAALYNVYGSDNSFTLNEGATIIGDILASSATNNSLKFNLGASTSYRYSVSGKGEGTGAGQWTFSDLDGRTQGVTTTGTGCDTTITTITVCNLVTGVSTGNLEVQDELQFSMNSSMISSLEFGSGQADAPAEAMSFTQSSKSNTWANVYGGTSKRASSTTKPAFDTSNRGLTIGTPVSINDTLDVDLVFNVSRTSLDTGLTKDQEITSNSYNLGAVLRDLAPSTGWAVDAFGFVGRNSYDGKRKVMNNQEATGSETVTAAYSGSEVLVGVDAQYSNPINDTLNFIGGVNASLSNEKIGAYSESKYYAWDARTLTQAIGGFTAGLEYQKDALTTFASLGLQRSSLQNGKTATYTNNGTAASFTDSSTGDTRRSITVGFDYVGNEGMTFSGAVEAFSSTGGVSGNSASLTANWKF